MAAWFDLPAEIRDIILEYYFYNKKIIYKPCPVREGSSQIDAMSLVSKKFTDYDSIARAVFKASILVIDDEKELTQIRSKFQPRQLKLVTRVRTSVLHFPHTYFAYRYETKCLNHQDLRATCFPNLQEMDVHVHVPGRYTGHNAPIIVLDEGPLPRWDAFWIYIEREGGADSIRHNGLGGDLSLLSISVTYLKYWTPITSFTETMLAKLHNPRYSELGAAWYILLKRRVAESGIKCRLLMDVYIAKGREGIDARIRATSRTLAAVDEVGDTKLLRISIDMSDHCLRFHHGGWEVRVPQQFSRSFDRWEQFVLKERELFEKEGY